MAQYVGPIGIGPLRILLTIRACANLPSSAYLIAARIVATLERGVVVAAGAAGTVRA